MTNTLTLETSVSIKASKAKVWNALTDPEQIKKYFFLERILFQIG